MESTPTCTCKKWILHKRYSNIRLCATCSEPHPDDVFYGVGGEIYSIATKELLDKEELRRIRK